MRNLSSIAVLVLALALPGCGKKQDEREVAAECQPTADRENQSQDQLRRDLAAQGVHDKYLPCGKYAATKAPNGYWSVTKETAGCPPTASQQDPHPDLGKAKKSSQ